VDIPWEAGPFEFTVPGGETSLVELRVPQRGVINAWDLRQVDGVIVGGDFRILNRHQAALDMAGSSLSSVSSPATPAGASDVVGVQTISGAGSSSTYERNFAYVNRDGNATSPVRKLYLVISPAGAGDKTYSLTLTILIPNL
jgi:hypothetical protein